MNLSSIKRPIRSAYNGYLFRSGLSSVSRLKRGETPRRADLEHLQIGWGNSGWSGDSTFLQAACWFASSCDGPILECGSGLSTILLATIPRLPGADIYTLEHIAEWCDKVQAKLNHHSLKASVNHAPLRSYGNFDWYTPPDSLPNSFSLVICDGPPSATRGGRYGLLPVMRERIQKAIVLLDDAEREDEKRIIQQWQSEYGYSVHNLSSGDGTVALMLPTIESSAEKNSRS